MTAGVIFPTIQFAVFFAVVLTINWLLLAASAPVEVFHADRQLLLLCVLGLAVLFSPRLHDARRPHHRRV